MKRHDPGDAPRPDSMARTFLVQDSSTASDDPRQLANIQRSNEAAARLWPLVARRDYRRALAFLHDLDPREVEPSWIAYHLGKVHSYRGKWNRALEFLWQAVSLAPENPVMYHGLGIALHQVGCYEDAANAHGRATELRRDYVEAWVSTGIAWLHDGQPDAASGAFRVAMLHAARQTLAACGYPVPALVDTPSGVADDDPMLERLELPQDVALSLVQEGRFAQIAFHEGMAQVAADRHELANQSFEEALAFGLSGAERRNAEAWLANYAAGKVTRRLN